MAKRILIHPETGIVIESRGSQVDKLIRENTNRGKMSKAEKRSLRNKEKKRQQSKKSDRTRYSS